MMGKLVTIGLILAFKPALVLAAVASFQVQTQIYIDGQLASSTRALVQSGTSTSLDSRTPFSANAVNLNVKATDRADLKDGITLVYEIDYQKGSEKLHMQPTFVNKSGYESTFKVNQDGKEVVIKSVATKI